MEKGVREVTKEKSNKRKFLVLVLAVLVVGLIAASLLYRGSITSRITGEAVKDSNGEKTITESEASNKLLESLNKKYGEVKFFSSEDLGSIYLIIVEKDGQRGGYFVTKDGKFYSEATYLEPFDQEEYKK